MSADRILRVIIAGDTKGLQKAVSETLGQTSKASSGLDKFAKVGKAAFLGIAGGALTFGALSVRTALQGEQSQSRLEVAIKNAGGSYKAYGSQIDDAISKAAKLGFQNDEVRDTLATLTAATHDPAKALADLSLAENVARARHITLASSTSLLAKVETGHVALLGRLGIQTKDASGKTISQTAALQKLAAMYGGAAQASANTFSGKVAAVRAQLHNTEDQIGQKLIPVLVTMIGKVQSVVGWLEKHRAVAIALAAAVGTVTTALIAAYVATKVMATYQTLAKGATAAWNIATKAATIAQAAFNAVMDANPIVLVVAAVVALGAGIYLAYKHFGPFHDAVDKAWQILQSTFHWVQKNWPLLLAILTGPIGLAVLVISKHWSTITNAASAAFGWVKKNWPLILAIITGPIGLAVLFVTRNWDKIRSAAATALGAVGGYFKSLPGKILGYLKGAGTWLADIGGQIVHGLWDGLKAGWTHLTSWLSGVIGKLTSPFKKILGIFSPSRVFRGLGFNTMEGFRLGLADGWSRVTGDMASMGSGLGTPTIGAASSAPAASGGLGAHSKWGGGTTIHVDARGALLDANAFARYLADLIVKQKGGPMELAIRQTAG